jgi:DNA repair ATPase RecN
MEDLQMKKIVFLAIGSAVMSVAATIVDILAYRNAQKRLEEVEGKANNALNRVDTLEFETKELKKEKIDDWMDSASEVLANQQDELDRIGNAIGRIQVAGVGSSKEIDILQTDIKDIKEILEEKCGVKFDQSQNNDD